MIPEWTGPLLPEDASPEQMIEWVNTEMNKAILDTLSKADEMRSRTMPDGRVKFFVPIE